jgi:biopolymer transport protein ExbB
LGLIDAFAFLRVGQVGGDETANVTAGISEALVSTAAGLIVAIITLLFTNLFRGLYRRQLALLQKYLGDFELKYRQEYEQRMDAYYAQQEFYRPQTPYLRDSDPDYDGDPDGPNSGGPDVPSV